MIIGPAALCLQIITAVFAILYLRVRYEKKIIAEEKTNLEAYSNFSSTN